MAKRTVGERIASGRTSGGVLVIDQGLANKIDRAIRRAKAEAFEEGWAAYDEWGYRNGSDENPYRKGVKR